MIPKQDDVDKFKILELRRSKSVVLGHKATLLKIAFLESFKPERIDFAKFSFVKH
ncbi:hypothetical protein [Arcticibacterium luteifluviistationis]|uniref:hypothetical protein n=1 Tax=Arcticibacterium luteifluviistationis TaxID=1784714 RepID=UPI0013A69ED6|nr:hypothetical protein [Arcticibacterium luteifluviistationis]